jgi:indole-3-glycerol phosphate synthase
MLLDRMIELKRGLWELPPGPPAPPVERQRPLRPGRFTAAVSGEEVGIIAETVPSVWSAAIAYEAGGAAAVSVPADELIFGGGPELVRRVAGAVEIPVLFQDIVVDARQLDMAYACGADAVSVVVRALDDTELADLTAIATGLGLDVVLTAFDEHDIERALGADVSLLGVMSVRLRGRLPAGVPSVIRTSPRHRADVERLARLGFTGCVVGRSLLAGGEPAAAVRAMTGVATAAL